MGNIEEINIADYDEKFLGYIKIIEIVKGWIQQKTLVIITNIVMLLFFAAEIFFLYLWHDAEVKSTLIFAAFWANNLYVLAFVIIFIIQLIGAIGGNVKTLFITYQCYAVLFLIRFAALGIYMFAILIYLINESDFNNRFDLISAYFLFFVGLLVAAVLFVILYSYYATYLHEKYIYEVRRKRNQI